VLKLDELKIFMGRLQFVKVPTNYCGAIGKHIMDKKLGSMKSLDWHVLMQQLMPFGFTRTNGCQSLTKFDALNRIFHTICAKVWDPIDLVFVREDVVVTFSLLEWELPGVFFDVMTHLVLHMVEELAISGPVHK